MNFSEKCVPSVPELNNLGKFDRKIVKNSRDTNGLYSVPIVSL